MDSEGIPQAGLNTNRIKKREPVRPHTEGRTRNARAVWLVADASDRADVDMDEPADPDGFGEETTDTVGTARVLAAPPTPTKTEREEHDVSHVPYRPWCRFCVMGRGLERRHLTQIGDHDADRPRVFVDFGFLSGDSTPLLGAKDFAKKVRVELSATVCLGLNSDVTHDVSYGASKPWLFVLRKSQVAKCLTLVLAFSVLLPGVIAKLRRTPSSSLKRRVKSRSWTKGTLSNTLARFTRARTPGGH